MKTLNGSTDYRCYWNLHKETFSIQHYRKGIGWRVWCHVPEVWIENPTFSATTNTSSTFGTVATQILASKDNVQYRKLSNVGPFDGYISATTTGLVAGTGLWVKASSSVEFFGDSLFTGTFYGIAAGTTTFSIVQL